MRGDVTGWVRRLGAAFGILAGLAACNNSPQADGAEKTNTLFSAFSERSPRYLDPTASYSNNETPITFQVYETLYGYHYLKRPYELIPKLATEVVEPKYLDKAGQPRADGADPALIAESVYDIPIKKGVMYAPHPAFAKDAQGRYLYHEMKPGEVGERRSPAPRRWTATCCACASRASTRNGSTG